MSELEVGDRVFNTCEIGRHPLQHGTILDGTNVYGDPKVKWDSDGLWTYCSSKYLTFTGEKKEKPSRPTFSSFIREHAPLN